MICNFELTLDKEKEFEFYEYIQSFLMMAQMLSPHNIESECVTSSYSNDITIRLKNFEITREMLDDWNQQSLKIMETLCYSYDDTFPSKTKN